jgi:hypothetical protein
MKKVLLSIVAFALFVLGAACDSQPWIVVRQAAPDPFLGHTQFRLELIHFEHAQIGDRPSEAAFLSDKRRKELDDWEVAKRGMNDNFAQGLAEGHVLIDQGAPFVIRPIVSFADPGKYAFIYARNTNVSLTVQLVDANSQQVLDEIGIAVTVGSSMYDPSADHRLREAADTLGKLAANYVSRRAAGR